MHASKDVFGSHGRRSRACPPCRLKTVFGLAGRELPVQASCSATVMGAADSGRVSCPPHTQHTHLFAFLFLPTCPSTRLAGALTWLLDAVPVPQLADAYVARHRRGRAWRHSHRAQGRAGQQRKRSTGRTMQDARATAAATVVDVSDPLARVWLHSEPRGCGPQACQAPNANANKAPPTLCCV